MFRRTFCERDPMFWILRIGIVVALLRFNIELWVTMLWPLDFRSYLPLIGEHFATSVGVCLLHICVSRLPFAIAICSFFNGDLFYFSFEDISLGLQREISFIYLVYFSAGMQCLQKCALKPLFINLILRLPCICNTSMIMLLLLFLESKFFSAFKFLSEANSASLKSCHCRRFLEHRVPFKKPSFSEPLFICWFYVIKIDLHRVIRVVCLPCR